MKCAWNELLRVLPPKLCENVDRLCRDTLQEIRLRLNKQAVLSKGDGQSVLPHVVTREDLQYVINAASRYSPWTAATTERGYITAPGGHRVGLCGEVLLRNGQVQGIGTVNSMNIRVARDFPGISGNLWLRKENLLILGPPGSGKTTLLRDLIRQRGQQQRIGVVDERGELFPTAADFSSGQNTDVLTGCDKRRGMDMVLRTMTPECIAIDEITAQEDCEALIQAGWCGVSLLATAHATSVRDLKSRPVYQPLVACRLFDTAVVLRPDMSWFTERMMQ